MRRHPRMLALSAVGMLLLAACGDDNSGAKSGGTTDSEASSTAAVAGEPVRIGSIYPIDAVNVSFPDLEYIAEIAVKSVNDKGGVHGRPLEWVHCDDKGDPNTAQQCANKVINEDKVLALVNQVGLQTGTVWPFITQANIISWFNIPVTPDDGTSPLSYPAGLGIYAHQNVRILAKDEHFETVDCVYGDSPIGAQICGFARDALTAEGVSTVNMVSYPRTTTNFQPIAAKLLADDPDAIVLVSSDATTATLLQAIADAGLSKPILEPSTSVGTRSLEVITNNDMDVRIAGGFGVDPDVFPGRAAMEGDIQKYAASVGAPANFDTISDNAIGMYTGIIAFAEIMNQVGSVSIPEFQAYVAQNPVLTGLSAPLDWTKPGPVPNQPRVVNVYATAEKVAGGKVESTSEMFTSGFSGVADIDVADITPAGD